MTKSNLNSKIQEIKDLLNQGIKTSLNNREKFKELLQFTNKFTNYSRRNSMIIFLTGYFRGKDYQFCKTYNAWNKEGIRIKPGEKGIQILAPNMLTFHSLYNLETLREETISDFEYKQNKELYENQSKYQYLKKFQTLSTKSPFRYITVFDISQTTATEDYLPKLMQGLKNTTIPEEIQLPLLKEYIFAHHEIPVEFKDVGIAGYKGQIAKLDENKYKITLNSINTEAQNVKTLLHELGHYLMHFNSDKQYTKNEKEVMAESFAFIISDYFGLDTSDYSFDYIAGWKKEVVDDQRYGEVLDETINNVTNTIESLEKFYEKTIKRELSK